MFVVPYSARGGPLPERTIAAGSVSGFVFERDFHLGAEGHDLSIVDLHIEI